MFLLHGLLISIYLQPLPDSRCKLPISAHYEPYLLLPRLYYILLVLRRNILLSFAFPPFFKYIHIISHSFCFHNPS